ncbi:Lipopolysaccharide export system protein LptC [Zhongshania aliphaticivorans]|uniref:Lipopolysaccharide export system protein LptC n=1 Tax=Zhongshania aliphaticivorans TaxID=1470434 RepID=A0A5S9N5Y3_9GAMM|nr:LPS export ABC transporter periplasmic protein LptC [Zhongshania aliphaticivorans]CAA0083392.1 Lipopolysaccharide export system protein LptC [Zhongshania aliphaticivorans]CAA0083397.1 Lipopolysaccharide export system protein LptC [Zhongshania aliphaticivorans]
MKGFNFFTLLSVLSAIAALAGTVLYLTQYSESGKLSIADQFEAIPDADSHLIKVNGIKYSSGGAVAYQWRASSAERLISDGSVTLKDPFYVGNIAEQRPWTASALSGKLSQDGEQLILENTVIVKDLIRQAEITTEALNINLENSEVNTPLALTLKLRNGKTHSVGMRASLKDERVELLNKVEGNYEP